jgi:hypothetical protein
MAGDRDNGGRFRPGVPSPNPNGRPRKARGVDAAMLGALSEKVTVTEQGQRKRRSKLDITATQIANKGAGGDLRAAKMALDQARKAEERAEADTVRAPIMTEADHAIAARVIARLKLILATGGSDDAPEA